MIRKITLLTTLFFIAIMGIDSAYNHAHTNATGAPAGRTGSPGDGGLTCSANGCHGATPQPGNNMFFVGVPAAGYNPGQTYLVQVSFNGTNAKGFQISPQNQNGTLLGQLINTTTSGNQRTQTVGSGKYITHGIAQSTANASWTFQWRAPSAGTGPVTFYGAFVNGRNTELRTQAITVQENPAASVNEAGKLQQFRMYPNPVNDRLTLSYTLERAEKVIIKLYDIMGREAMQLLNETQDAGEHQMSYDLKPQLNPGVYFVSVDAGGKRFSQKLLVK